MLTQRDRLVIDIGAYWTRIYLNEKLVLDERSGALYNGDTGEFKRAGSFPVVGSIHCGDFKHSIRTLLKTPDDIQLIHDMLVYFIGQIRPRRYFWNPVVAVSIGLSCSEEYQDSIRGMIPRVLKESKKVKKRR